MAIIKCPECGHQISDKAPTCPSCGVEIAGHITHCQQCGAVYLSEQDSCPICHHANTSRPAQRMAPTTPPPIPTNLPPQQNGNATPEQPKKKHSRGALIFSFLMAMVICGVCFYFYHNAKDTKESEAYTYAMTSSDPLVLQSFLDTYRDASHARRDSIQLRLTAIQQAERDWTNACASKSKTMLLEFIKQYPQSAHKGEALNKIDSIDWEKAKAENTEESFYSYQREHPNGKYVGDADEEIKKLNAKTLQPEEEETISLLYRRFFQGINSRNASQVGETVASVLKNFQGRPDALKSDVMSYVNSLWRPDVENMNWYLPDQLQIDKKEVSVDQYEYDVHFNARQKVVFNNGKPDSETRYRVSSHVNAEFRIVEFNMSRIIE